MNGIDFLFVAVGLILFLVVIEIWDRYRNWSEWDRERRIERKRKRYEFQDSLSEMSYRIYLRGSSSGFTEAIQRATRSIEKFHEAFRGQTHV